MIGQGLKHNKEKNISDLATGQDFNFIEQTDEQNMTIKESNKIAKSFIYTCLIVFGSSIYLFNHHNYSWYITFLLAFLIGLIIPILYFILGVYITRFTKRKNIANNETN